MLHAVLKPDSDTRFGREHVFGILVFWKKGVQPHLPKLQRLKPLTIPGRQLLAVEDTPLPQVLILVCL
jgi:hypothetical protein